LKRILTMAANGVKSRNGSGGQTGERVLRLCGDDAGAGSALA